MIWVSFWFGFSLGNMLTWFVRWLAERDTKELQEQRVDALCDKFYAGMRKRGATTLVVKPGGAENES